MIYINKVGKTNPQTGLFGFMFHFRTKAKPKSSLSFDLLESEGGERPERQEVSMLLCKSALAHCLSLRIKAGMGMYHPACIVCHIIKFFVLKSSGLH